MFKITGHGMYLNRKGRPLWVRPNVEHWLDDLPFIVSLGPTGSPRYTVDEWGKVWPENHRMFKDTQGFYQPDLFGFSKWETPDDLIARG